MTRATTKEKPITLFGIDIRREAENHTIEIDGRRIELSEESYRRLKQQLSE